MNSFKQLRSYSNINDSVHFDVYEVLKIPPFWTAFKSPALIRDTKQIFYDPLEFLTLPYDYENINQWFNVFHVRALYYKKNTNHQRMHKKSSIINCSTLVHVSTLLGHLQGELFVIVTLRLHFIVE
jgi:hypothetical protein